MITPSYVLITPTKNEERLIGRTIDSVVRQTCLPAEWVIVDDGSTDQTAEIVRRAARLHPWIRLVPRPAGISRNFAAVVHATEAGVAALRTTGYEYLGLLDSDVEFPADYFERVLAVFAADARLGLAGGLVLDPGASSRRLPRNRQDVPGATQMFRRVCFEKLGGLLAIPEGGWDALTCVRARMCGYETRLLTDLIVTHLKPRNSAEGGRLRRCFQLGIRDYALGYGFWFECVKCASRLGDPPWLAGAVLWWAGYCSARFRRHPVRVPADLVRYMRQEQLRRIFRRPAVPEGLRRLRTHAAPADRTGG
jgi:glycosyltransferase involved in cell wall biosynthesis